MAIPLTINGATFEYPQNFDEAWGIEATGWAQAVTNGLLQMSGGSFPLTADVNFGPNFGLLSKYFETRSALPATTGTVRLSSADAGIAFRNNANSGNLVLTTNAADILLFNGTPVGTSGTLTNSHIFVGNVSNIQADVAMSGDVHIDNTGATTIQPSVVTGAKIAAATITDANIAAAAAIAVSKLAALSVSRIVVSDASGFLTTIASPTLTEIAFVGGVTSSIQTQINATVTVANAALPKTGGTMSGAIAMGSNKITGLANGTVATDAAAFGQIPVFTPWAVYTTTITGGGTITNSGFLWRQEADNIHIKGAFQTGTVAASTASFTLPAGKTIDITKIPGPVVNSALAGTWFSANGVNFGSGDAMGAVFSDNSTTDTLYFCRQGASGSGFSKQNGNTVWSSNVYILLDINIAIS